MVVRLRHAPRGAAASFEAAAVTLCDGCALGGVGLILAAIVWLALIRYLVRASERSDRCDES